MSLFFGINHCQLSQNQLAGYYKWLWWLRCSEQSLSQLYQRNLQSKQNLSLCSLVVASLSSQFKDETDGTWNTHEQLLNEMDFCWRPVWTPVKRSNIVLIIHQLTFWSRAHNSINAAAGAIHFIFADISHRLIISRAARGEGWQGWVVQLSPNVDSHI